MALHTRPDLEALVMDILGEPYERFQCWQLVRHLYQVGLGLDIVEDPLRAAQELREVWFQGDARDPLTLVQPWDVFIMRRHGVISEHVGLVMDAHRLVHTRRTTGVVIEPLTRWHHKLLQLARLRLLEGVA